VSVIDELKGLEDRVARRMSELRPLVDEYRELEKVAQRLGVTPSAAPDASSRPRRSRRRARPRAAANSGAATKASGPRSNGRRDELLAMVKARPGITVREIGTELGVDPTSLYRIVHRLEADGAVKKRGRELLPG
jgi:Homeodomain-like domain